MSKTQLWYVQQAIKHTCWPALSARLAAGYRLPLSASLLKLLLSPLLPDAAPEDGIAVLLVIMTMLASYGQVLVDLWYWMQC